MRIQDPSDGRVQLHENRNAWLNETDLYATCIKSGVRDACLTYVYARVKHWAKK